MTAASPPSRLLDAAALLAWVMAVVVTGAAMGLLFPPDAWYDSLNRPTWNPPRAVFAPVWTSLFVLLGISAWLVGRQRDVAPRELAQAWLAFALQHALCLAWPPLFFGWHAPGWAFADVCLLWLALFWMTLRFGRIRPLAGYLLLPQGIWVSFALVLNGTIWLMNS